MPSFKFLSASQRSLSETLSIEHVTSEHDKEHHKQNKTLYVGLLLRLMRERFLSNVYDVEKIVEAPPALKDVIILEVNHVIEVVVVDNPIVCEETIERGLPCTSIVPLRQAIIPASSRFLAFDPFKFDALISEKSLHIILQNRLCQIGI